MAKEWQVGDKAKVSRHSDVIYTIADIDGHIAQLDYMVGRRMVSGGQMDVYGLRPLTKLDMAREIVQALFNMGEPPAPDHFQVTRMARKRKAEILDHHSKAVKILADMVK